MANSEEIGNCSSGKIFSIYFRKVKTNILKSLEMLVTFSEKPLTFITIYLFDIFSECHKKNR